MTEVIAVLSATLGFLAIWMTYFWSRRTDKLIKSEDARAKQTIDDGSRRTQQMIEDGHKRLEVILGRMDDNDRRTQEMIEEGNKHTREILAHISDLIEKKETAYYVKDKK
jgi:uncharacterized membrane protein